MNLNELRAKIPVMTCSDLMKKILPYRRKNLRNQT